MKIFTTHLRTLALVILASFLLTNCGRKVTQSVVTKITDYKKTQAQVDGNYFIDQNGGTVTGKVVARDSVNNFWEILYTGEGTYYSERASDDFNTETDYWMHYTATPYRGGFFEAFVFEYGYIRADTVKNETTASFSDTESFQTDIQIKYTPTLVQDWLFGPNTLIVGDTLTVVYTGVTENPVLYNQTAQKRLFTNKSPRKPTKKSTVAKPEPPMGLERPDIIEPKRPTP